MKKVVAITVCTLVFGTASAESTDRFLQNLRLSPAACQPFVAELRSEKDWKITPAASDASGPVFRLQNSNEYFHLMAATARTHYIQAAAAFTPAGVQAGPDIIAMANTIALSSEGKLELSPASRGGPAVGDAMLTNWANTMTRTGRPGPASDPMFAAFFWCR